MEYEYFRVGIIRLIIPQVVRRNCVEIKQNLRINAEPK